MWLVQNVALTVAATPQMWLTLAVLAVALVLYISEKVPVEVISLGLLGVMLLAFHVFPVLGPDGRNRLAPDVLLGGFGNPALLTVMALLVVGEALSRTGALDSVAGWVAKLPISSRMVVVVTLVIIAVTSAFINDTPVVVMFMPVMQALALRARMSSGRVMMPLSFAAVLGGMLTLIGSSTNLLVSSALIAQGVPGLDFFEQTPIALLLAVPGFLYVLVIMPHLLPRRDGGGGGRKGENGKQFVAECVVGEGSPLNGVQAAAGVFRPLPGITVHLVIRGGQSVPPPYDELTLVEGDLLVLAGTRKALADAAARFPGLLTVPDDGEEDQPLPHSPLGSEQVLVEAMLPPSSQFTGFSVGQLGLQRYYGVQALGVERRARMVRGPLSAIRLQAGDVLLLLGTPSALADLRGERDLVVVSGSAGSLPRVHHAGITLAVFGLMVAMSASAILPITISALLAAVLLVGVGALNPRQAVAAIDSKVVFLVGNALALGEAMEATGAAAYLAQHLLAVVGGHGPWLAVVAFFVLVALITNVLSNNACAVLFTPIGVGVARQLGVDPHLFAIATILAANCSFATPIGYQTNLLVMGPGHYRFADYVRAGGPLVFLLIVMFALGAKLLWRL